jgi:hypothetical protein
VSSDAWSNVIKAVVGLATGLGIGVAGQGQMNHMDNAEQGGSLGVVMNYMAARIDELESDVDECMRRE